MSNFQVPVRLYMSQPAITIVRFLSLEAAWDLMTTRNVSSLPVVDREDRLQGVLTRTDLLRVGRREAGRRPGTSVLTLPERTVSDEMTHQVQALGPDAPLSEAAALMVKHSIHRVVVTDPQERVLGVLSTWDLMRALEEKEANHPVSEYMSSPIFTIRAEDPVGMAVERLERARVSGLVVVENGWPVGVFTQAEALGARDVALDTPVEKVMSSRLLTLPSRTRMYRAAAQAAATRVRRVVLQDGDALVGILSGLDFARAVA